MMRHQSEKGAAMVLVLGIVAVMSSLAIFSFDSLTRLIALTTAKNYAAQTDHYARGAELVAIDVGRQAHRARRRRQYAYCRWSAYDRKPNRPHLKSDNRT